MTHTEQGLPDELVFDTTALYHFALADRLDVLGDLLAGCSCYTTDLVLDEIHRNARVNPGLYRVDRLQWITRLGLDSFDALDRFDEWARLLGAGSGHHLGEASVFSCAESMNATAVTDDRDATIVGRKAGLDVHGTIWLLAGACREKGATEAGAAALIDALCRTGARLPCTGSAFPAYARRHGLL